MVPELILLLCVSSRSARRRQAERRHEGPAGRHLPQVRPLGLRGPTGAHPDHQQGRVPVHRHGGGAGQISVSHHQVRRNKDPPRVAKDFSGFPERLSDLFHSARESPVAWEGEAVENLDNNQPSQPGAGGGPEGRSSPAANQAARRWEVEEEPKDEQTAHEDEGSTSGVSFPSTNQRRALQPLVIDK